eukprot:5483738-Pleurochrysis_carterae.AAC.1
MRIQREKVVHVAAQRKSVLHAVDGLGHGEYTRIGFALSETELEEPWEERALPPPTGLGPSVNWFFDAAYARASISADGR